jgi:hypothetical protein
VQCIARSHLLRLRRQHVFLAHQRDTDGLALTRKPLKLNSFNHKSGAAA